MAARATTPTLMTRAPRSTPTTSTSPHRLACGSSCLTAFASCGERGVAAAEAGEGARGGTPRSACRKRDREQGLAQTSAGGRCSRLFQLAPAAPSPWCIMHVLNPRARLPGCHPSPLARCRKQETLDDKAKNVKCVYTLESTGKDPRAALHILQHHNQVGTQHQHTCPQGPHKSPSVWQSRPPA